MIHSAAFGSWYCITNMNLVLTPNLNNDNPKNGQFHLNPSLNKMKGEPPKNNLKNLGGGGQQNLAAPLTIHSKLSGGIFLFLFASIIVCTKDIYNAQLIWNWNIAIILLINSTHYSIH